MKRRPMKPKDRLDPDGQVTKVWPLEVFRVEEGESFSVRPLADSYNGLLTHFDCRSIYCPGQKCPPRLHNRRSIWKGYAPTLLYNEQTKGWHAIVLEITECLDHDLSGRFSRGTEWLLSRQKKSSKRETPVTGTNVPLDPALAVWLVCNLPPAFDCIPTLRRLYRETDVSLDVANPVPRSELFEQFRDPPKK